MEVRYKESGLHQRQQAGSYHEYTPKLSGLINFYRQGKNIIFTVRDKVDLRIFAVLQLFLIKAGKYSYILTINNLREDMG
jgi:hypothetical protein